MQLMQFYGTLVDLRVLDVFGNTGGCVLAQEWVSGLYTSMLLGLLSVCSAL